jgi:hypothetical protein
VHLVERCDAFLIHQLQAQLEFGTGEMDDVILFEQAVALNPLAVDEGTVGAVFVDQPQEAQPFLVATGRKDIPCRSSRQPESKRQHHSR